MLKTQRGHITSDGWLYEDGVLDVQACYLAASGRRRPDLTYREGMVTVFLLMRRGTRNCDISRLLKIDQSRISSMVLKINKNMSKYESMLSQESSRPIG